MSKRGANSGPKPSKVVIEQKHKLEDLPIKEDLDRANSILGKKKRKSFAEKTIGRAGPKNKPAEFTLAEPYPFDLDWSFT